MKICGPFFEHWLSLICFIRNSAFQEFNFYLDDNGCFVVVKTFILIIMD